MEVLSGPPGIAYVAWQTDGPRAGYATYLRTYSIAKGWLGPRIRVSTKFGNRQIWPGDTFGIAHVPGGPGTRLALSWGSAIPRHKNSLIYAAVVSLPTATVWPAAAISPALVAHGHAAAAAVGPRRLLRPCDLER